MDREKAFELMRSAHERGKLAHAFLISGQPGSGKQELAARVIDLLSPAAADTAADLWGEPVEEAAVKELDECEGEFVQLVRPRSKSRAISVSEIRELERRMHLSSPEDTWKVGVVVDADRMNESAENAFLKTLEEPPERCLLLLLSANPEFLLPTIRSRCINLTLRADGPPEVLEAEEKSTFTALLARTTATPSPQHALLLKSGFESLLAGRKKAIEDKHAAAFKEEEKAYKKVTEGDWLENREKYYAALSSAEYLGVRGGLVQWLISWVGDALRQKVGAAELSFPLQAKQTNALAENQDVSGLLRRIEALQELSTLLETNTSEGLAIEVSFLKAFS